MIHIVDGYRIYDKENSKIYFDFDKGIDNKGSSEILQTINTSQQILNTFGQFPYVYIAGNMNYKTFELSSTFIEDYFDDIKLSAKQQVDNFVNLINEKKPLVVENSMGEKMLCHIQIKSISAPMLFEFGGMEYINVNISCTEIGKYEVGV